MKTLNLWTIFSIAFICLASSVPLTSCSADTNSEGNFIESSTNQSNVSLQRVTGLYPENPANSYDAAGQLYYDISESFYSLMPVTFSTTETIQQVEAIANANFEFQSLKPSSYTSPTAARLDYILNNPQLSKNEILQNSGMSAIAKESLGGFLDPVMLYHVQHFEYDSIYHFITDYEMGIIGNNTYSAQDKKIILTTTSIARYALYFAKKHRRKPRDRDWDISWGNIVAGTEGSSESTAKAIIMSAVIGLITNK